MTDTHEVWRKVNGVWTKLNLGSSFNGGTITGDIAIQKINPKLSLQRTSNVENLIELGTYVDDEFILEGRIKSNNGRQVSIESLISTKDYGPSICLDASNGSFTLSAYSLTSETHIDLVGAPDGTLKWNGTALLNETSGDARYLKLTGGTLTGNLILNGGYGVAGVHAIQFTDTGSMEIAALQHVLNGVELYLNVVAGTVAGPSFNLNLDGSFEIGATTNRGADKKTLKGVSGGDLTWGGSRVALATDLSTYLPLTGGTMTGIITLDGKTTESPDVTIGVDTNDVFSITRDTSGISLDVTLDGREYTTIKKNLMLVRPSSDDIGYFGFMKEGDSYPTLVILDAPVGPIIRRRLRGSDHSYYGPDIQFSGDGSIWIMATDAQGYNGKSLALTSTSIQWGGADVLTATNGVPNTRTVNSKALSADITLSATDVLTEAQQNAVNSGITQVKLEAMEEAIGTVESNVIALQSGKQDTLSSTRLAACDSGITAAKVSTYDGYAATIAGKLDTTTAASTYLPLAGGTMTGQLTVPVGVITSSADTIVQSFALTDKTKTESYADLRFSRVNDDGSGGSVTKNLTYIRVGASNFQIGKSPQYVGSVWDGPRLELNGSGSVLLRSTSNPTTGSTTKYELTLSNAGLMTWGGSSTLKGIVNVAEGSTNKVTVYNAHVSGATCASLYALGNTYGVTVFPTVQFTAAESPSGSADHNYLVYSWGIGKYGGLTAIRAGNYYEYRKINNNGTWDSVWSVSAMGPQKTDQGVNEGVLTWDTSKVTTGSSYLKAHCRGKLVVLNFNVTLVAGATGNIATLASGWVPNGSCFFALCGANGSETLRARIIPSSSTATSASVNLLSTVTTTQYFIGQVTFFIS